MVFNIRGFTLHRKELYTSLSILLAILLFCALVNDFVSIINVEMPENSTHEFTFTILLLHCASFTLSILGFIYHSLAGKGTGTTLGQILVAFNMGLFITRIILELVFLEFRPEEMATTT
ncbi:uncharacterized protein LOC111324916 [Stylophora pistillata]|uniref:uncharacterized protein LOC111324916 n=1 Tax=Stylophora pistillata TaxID=50429 RepID=UPI000C03B0C6|nr:uncharacterized protein LOC111324916 [Stylophora pistillata]